MAAEFTPEELAMYILSLTVQDPDSLPEVEIAREKPLPFKPSGGGFGGKGKGAVGMAVVETNAVTEIAEMTVKVDAVISNASPIKIVETLKAKATNVLIVLPMKEKWICHPQ